MVFEKLKAAFFGVLTHTSFISRKVGFSRRWPMHCGASRNKNKHDLSRRHKQGDLSVRKKTDVARKKTGAGIVRTLEVTMSGKSERWRTTGSSLAILVGVRVSTDAAGFRVTRNGMTGVSFRDADFMVFAERCTKYKKRQSQDSDSSWKTRLSSTGINGLPESRACFSKQENKLI